ncbi:MAG: hypothetical protein L6R30_16655 [Thermoanaerobaculia bacterium]|nr:hypothetical protein [Thermoanaerobaculia bacterium]
MKKLKVEIATVLETGLLRNQEDGREYPFEIAELTPDNLDAVWGVQEVVVDTLEDPALYYPDPKELLLQCLGNRGVTIGTFVGQKLVGFRSIFFPGDRSDNLGLDLGMTDPALLHKVAHLERAAVIPAYRGNRLQIRMTSHAIRRASASGRWRYLFSTVAPGNFASMKDKFAVGMVIVKLLLKYADYWRYVFYQDIKAPITVDEATKTCSGSKEIARQREILGRIGLVGYAQEREGESVVVCYAHPSRPTCMVLSD